MAKKLMTIDVDALRRFKGAASNGSVVAAAILAELKKPRTEIVNGKADCIVTMRKTRHDGDRTYLDIRVGYNTQNFNDPRNPFNGCPDATERPTTKCWVSPSSFAGIFKNLRFAHTDLDFFESAVKEPTKITFTLSDKYADILTAYSATAYAPYCDSDGPLHKSCMRYENTAEIAADFYRNFAGAKILMARNGNGEVVGRALVWEHVDIYDCDGTLMYKDVSYLDRKYYCFAFIRKMILDEAVRRGINFCKAVDDYSSETVRVLNPTDTVDSYDESPFDEDEVVECRLAKKVPHLKWHQKGAPFVDTFGYLCYGSDKELLLSNHYDGRYDDYQLAELRNTGGWATRQGVICPCCGRKISRYDIVQGADFAVCQDCFNELYEKTGLGHVYRGKLLTYNGHKYPAKIVKSEYLQLATCINRLFRTDGSDD